MSLAQLLTSAITAESGPKPHDNQLDVFGITDVGKVRKENQDHFLIATVHQQLAVLGTSFPNPAELPVRGERLATIFLVADGVAGSPSGREASELTVATIAHYVSSTMRCFHASGAEGDEEEVLAALRAATAEAHQVVRAEANTRGEARMATTLTLVVTVWPRAYVVQVGDSRYYDFSGDRLRLVTRDQTLAQDLVDQGVLPAERLSRSPFRNVLARAIGAEEATPEVALLNLHQDSIGIICSDGLTTHVTDDEIAEQIRASAGSEQLCRSLLSLALDRGGTDNVTLVSARIVRRRQRGGNT